MMNFLQEAHYRNHLLNTRRHFLKQCATGLGGMALGSLLGCSNAATNMETQVKKLVKGLPHFAPKAKRVIFLHMAGAPSQLELFDYKPELEKLDGKECPASLLEGKNFAFISGVPKMLGPQARFKQHGQSGAWISDRLPHFAQVADEVCFLKAMHTDQFNHAPAQLFLHSGSPRLGRPSMGFMGDLWFGFGK